MYARPWPITLIALCSALAGCAPALPAVVVNPPAVACPEPGIPVLPLVDGEQSFENKANLAVFMERDDILRSHIRALGRTINCYRAQTKGAAHVAE